MLMCIGGNLIAVGLITSVVIASSGFAFEEFQFAIEPSATVGVPGKPVLLECSITLDNLTLQPEISWRKEDIPLVYDSRRYILSNGSLYFRYVVHNVSHAVDEGDYQCVATVESLGTIVSNKAHLRILATSISSVFSSLEPAALHLQPGDVAMLTCHAEDHPAFAVRWFRSEKELNSASSGVLVHQDGVLEIRSLQSSDFGSYRCLLVDGRMEYTTLAWINHDAARTSYQKVSPQFVMRPMDRTVTEGSTVVLHCGANGRDRNRAQPKVLWLKDGATVEFLDEDAARSRYSITGLSSLKIRRVEEQDSGLYVCRASNREDTVDAAASLIVLVPPKVLIGPESAVGEVSWDLEFQCVVHGVPRPVVQWMKNGNLITLSDYNLLADGTNLHLLGLMPSDAGMYQCLASNDAGSLQRAAQLIVSSPPGVAQSVKGTPSAVIGLMAVPASAHSITLSWRPPARKGSSEVTTYTASWKESHSDRERKLNTSLLEADIQWLKAAAMYHFKVIAWNSYGPSSESAVVSVEMPTKAFLPDVPGSLCAVAVSPTSILIHWKAPIRTHGPIITYKVYYHCPGQGETSSAQNDFNVLENEFILAELQKFQVYAFRVVAYNSNGPGASTEEVTCRTLSDVPSQPPQNVSWEAVSSTVIVIQWDSPPEDSLNGIITGYKIRYRQRQDKTGGAGGAETITTDGTKRMCDISDLQKNTEYIIRVHALTVNGSGPGSPPITIKTVVLDLDESKVPGQPRSLRTQPFTNAIKVSWMAPAESLVAIRGYILGYGVGIPDVYQQILDPRQQIHTIKGLRSGSEYVLSLKAYNNAGEGRPVYDTIQTREVASIESVVPLLPPFGVRAKVLSSTSVSLTWSDSVPIRGQRASDSRVYTVRYNPKMLRKPKTINTTELSCQLDDLRPDTEYEFSVRIVNGFRHSPWSLSVFNKTREAVPSSPPRDLFISAIDGRPAWASLSWQPPRQMNGAITGYLVSYSMDKSLLDQQWMVTVVAGDRLSTVIQDLKLETVYYIKIQAQNINGYGPTSASAIFRTPNADGRGGGMVESAEYVDKISGMSKGAHSKSNDFPPFVVWIVAACIGSISVIAFVAVLTVFCHRRRRGKAVGGGGSGREEESTSPSSVVNSSATEGTKFVVEELKPPDLWDHNHQASGAKQSNLNASQSSSILEESEHCTQSTVASDGSVPISMEDMRYVALPNQPSMILHQPTLKPSEPRIGVASIGMNTVYQGTSLFPLYPRTQYASTPRVNIGDITQVATSSSVDYIMSTLERQRARKLLGTNPRLGSTSDHHALSPYQTSVPVTCDNHHQHPVSAAGAVTLSLPRPILSCSLKRFQTAPPAQSAPNTPHFKHADRRVPSVFYSASGDSSGISSITPALRMPRMSLQKQHKETHISSAAAQTDSLCQKSVTDERLCADMEHLEDLVKDLSTITRNELHF